MPIEQIIKQYVEAVAHNPGKNILQLFEELAQGNMYQGNPQTIVVPELKMILKSKRQVVQQIIKDKTNIDTVLDSGLMSSKPGMVIKKPGEKPIMGNIRLGNILSKESEQS